MNRKIALVAIALTVAGCSGTNPFLDEEPEVETTDPSTANSKFLFDLARQLTMNDVVYDADNDQLVINNLPFDGPDGRYDRLRGQGGAGVYRSRSTATTGQVDHYAVFVNADAMQAAAAAGADWIDFGYGGANVKRDSYALPGGVGEYVYTGVYAGVRTRDDRSGLEVVTGSTRLLLDILDLDPDGNILGSIAGNITNRQRTTEGGSSLASLPNVVLARVSLDSSTGTFVDGVASTFKPDGEPRDSGTYEGLIGGVDGSEMGAHVVIEGPGEIQEVFFEIVDWTFTEDVEVDLGGGLIVTETVTTTGQSVGLNNGNRESIVAIVDSGAAVGYLSADRSDIPDGAEIVSTTDSEIIEGDGRAREIGVTVTEQVE